MTGHELWLALKAANPKLPAPTLITGGQNGGTKFVARVEWQFEFGKARWESKAVVRVEATMNNVTKSRWINVVGDAYIQRISGGGVFIAHEDVTICRSTRCPDAGVAAELLAPLLGCGLEGK